MKKTINALCWALLLTALLFVATAPQSVLNKTYCKAFRATTPVTAMLLDGPILPPPVCGSWCGCTGGWDWELVCVGLDCAWECWEPCNPDPCPQ